MKRQRSQILKWASAPVLAASLAWLFALPSQAQIIADHNLAGATIVERGTCSILRIEFYSRVQMRSHFPEAIGDELRINLELLDLPTVAPGDKSTVGGDVPLSNAKPVIRREQTRAPGSERAAIGSIEFENSGHDQSLSVYFRHAVAFRVAPAKDARVLLIAIAGRVANADCKPEMDDTAAASSVPKTLGKPRPAPLDIDIAAARAAMAKSELDRAIALLTRATEAGTSKQLAEALELLGIAQEQKGHLVHARAEYQNYLKQFPKGEGFTRVQRRLAALDKREQVKPLPPPAITSAEGAPKLQGKPASTAASQTGSELRPSFADDARQVPEVPNAWDIQHSGSVSAYYNLNQGGRDFFIRPNLQNGWDKESVNRVYRNSVLSLGDYEGEASNPFYQARVHVSASQEKRFTDNDDEARISTLTFEGKHKESGSNLRVGRQTHYGGGVLGRFDGGILTVPVAADWMMRFYGGGPVERANDQPFQFDRTFYGASADYTFSKALDVGAFIVQQESSDFVERRAIGAEARYVDDKGYGFGSMDYDLYFGEINSLLGSGTINFEDKSSLTAMLDYRRSPTLFVSNALQGQVETSLQDLLGRYTTREIEGFARDRTPISTFASISYTRYLYEKLQITGEVTIANMSSMPESGGVAATLSTGWDTYSMLQLMATDVLRENDSVTGTIRYATAQAADRTLVEGSVRLPMNDPRWHVGPSLRLGVSEYKLEPTEEYIIHPMLRTSYNFSQNLQFEFEIGKRWTTRDTPRGEENETELLLLSGLRYDFNSNR